MSDRIWLWFADNGNIRKWQREPFPEGTEYVVAAQADAEADYASRIRSALVATPPSERVVEALEIARGYILRSNNHWKDDDLAKINAALATKPAVKDDETVVTVQQAASVLYEAFPDAGALPGNVRFHAGEGHFFSALRLLIDPEANLSAALAAKEGRS